MPKLIFNADDLGLSQGVNLGIVECYKNGVVNSASLLTNTPFFEQAVALIKQHQLPNIGLHFNLTEFKPVLNTHKTIVDSTGQFIRTITNNHSIDLTEVAAELEAQYQKAVAAKVAITHFDSHHHVHMNELLRKVFVKMAQKHQLPLRKTANLYRNPIKKLRYYWLYKNQPFYSKSFSSVFYDDKATLQTLQNLIHNAKGTLEIMCHPGYDDALNGEYNVQRVAEIKILTSPEVKKWVENANLKTV